MSLATPPPLGSRPHPLRWTGDAFDRASESGAFDNRRVELINGEVLEMPPMNEPHALVIQLATYVLIKLFPPDRFTLRVQCPMRLGESRPFPDFVITGGTPRQNLRHPTSAMLVIEVSDTTLDYDQTEKAELYAFHGIPEYWIVNLNARCLEVRRQPQGVGSVGARYAEVTIYAENQGVAPAGFPDSFVAVAELLP